MNKQVLCFGEVLWDAFGPTKTAGGAPMNVAWHLKQQGINVMFASSVGVDDPGDELVDFLIKNKLSSPLIQRDEDLPTCEVTVQLDEHGHATYIIPQPVSWDNIRVNNELIAAAKSATAIVYGTLANRERTTRDTLFDILDESTALTVLDVNLRAPHYELDTIQTLAAKARVIKMNEEEANLLIGDGKGTLQNKIIEFQHTYHAQTICVTRGDKGGVLWHDDKFYEHPGFRANVVDTVGAGDAFLATLVAGLLNNDNPQLILEKACKIGAFVAGCQGATPVYPHSLTP